MNDKDETVNNPNQTGTLSRIDPGDLLDPFWAYDGLTTGEDPPANSTGLVSLGFITAAIRRTALFWCATAVAGLLIGLGLFLSAPHLYQASASVFITHGPYSNSMTAIEDDQSVAQSRAVATLAMQRLGLQENVSNFDAGYTVAAVSPRVLLITMNAPSTSQAVARANAVAAAFLQFRARQLETAQNLVLRSLNRQISQSEQNIGLIKGKISQLSSQRSSPTQRATLHSLQAQQTQAAAQLTILQQAADSAQANPAVKAAVNGSNVLDAATPLPHSRLKPLLLYAGPGLLVGLVLGVGIVVVQALISDRLRWRDEIAHALDAPVKLSVGTVRLSRWFPSQRGLTAAGSAEVQAIVAQLRSSVPTSAERPAALAIVPADDPRVAALSLASLAVSFAGQGSQVILADLCPGAPAAVLLGVKGPGVHTVSVQGTRLVVAVPDHDDALPAGPRCPQARTPYVPDHAPALTQHSPIAEEITAAYASADLLLTLVALDPSLGGEHLPTWADDAVVVITAGRSSRARIRAIGEMIRLAGARLVSGVLVGADKTDESLGLAYTPGARQSARMRGQSL